MKTTLFMNPILGFLWKIRSFALMPACLSALCCLIPTADCEAQNSVNNKTVNKLDIDKFLGKWYEIARFDHRFEREHKNITAYYFMNKDGSISVNNIGWKDGKRKQSTGKAKITGTPGLLRVSFFWPFYSDYRVLMVADDYSYALIGGSDEDYLWLMSRSPTLTAGARNKMLQEASKRGYEIDNLIWVDQSGNTLSKLRN